MSLRRVDDAVTSDLMIECYDRLLRGEGWGEALRRPSSTMLRTPGRSPPYS